MTATGPAIMDVDFAIAKAAIERDLTCYADQWQYLQGEEAEAAYGPSDPDQADIQELNRKGTCILNVTLRPGMDCIEAMVGDSGRQIVEGAAVVISREHPKVDKLRTCTVATRRRGRLELRPGLPDVDIENDTWRLDVEVNYVPRALML